MEDSHMGVSPGSHMGVSQILGTWSTGESSRQYLWICITGLQCSRATSYTYKQWRETVPLPTSLFSSGPISVATHAGHSPLGQTHSRLPVINVHNTRNSPVHVSHSRAPSTGWR